MMVHHPELVSHPAEACRRGKPDQIEGDLVDIIGARILEIDSTARFDLRAVGYSSESRPRVDFSGEVSQSFLSNVDRDFYAAINRLAREHYNEVHRLHPDTDVLICNFRFNPQSHDLNSNTEAGDEGNPRMVAYFGTPNYLPWERFLAVGIRDVIDDIYQNDGCVPRHYDSAISHIDGLCADGKVTVRALYKGSNPKIEHVTVAVQHGAEKPIEELREQVTELVRAYISFWGSAYGFELGIPSVRVNGRGPWVKGGWEVDQGSREAKPQLEGAQSYGCIEDSGRGEDPTKPSRTGTILARAIAVSVVKSRLADFANVTLGYDIGSSDATLNIVTNGTLKLPQRELHDIVRARFPLNIHSVIERFDLQNPKVYRGLVSASDTFQDPNFSWNQPVVLHYHYKPEAVSAGQRGGDNGR